jgi:hypothetical protein
MFKLTHFIRSYGDNVQLMILHIWQLPTSMVQSMGRDF